MAATFPSGFLWGAATSAHQVEGNCTNNQWWAWEQEPGHIRDGDVSGVACDHYRRFDDDFRLAAELGHTAHRFSIEWGRIEPEEGRFDERELDHYRAVCDSVRRHGMAPTVTLHHFTHPLWVARAGGWENPRIVDWLARFAERAGRGLGDRVAIWWTINEPMVAPVLSYMLGIHPPGVQDVGRAFVVARHTLLSHGAMYRALRAVVPSAAPVGPVLNMMWFEPLDPLSPEDRGRAAGLLREPVVPRRDHDRPGPPAVRRERGGARARRQLRRPRAQLLHAHPRTGWRAVGARESPPSGGAAGVRRRDGAGGPLACARRLTPPAAGPR